MTEQRSAIAGAVIVTARSSPKEDLQKHENRHDTTNQKKKKQTMPVLYQAVEHFVLLRGKNKKKKRDTISSTAGKRHQIPTTETTPTDHEESLSETGEFPLVMHENGNDHATTEQQHPRQKGCLKVLSQEASLLQPFRSSRKNTKTIPYCSECPTCQQSASQQQQNSTTSKEVHFSDITVRLFPIILGDNPAVTSGGPPIQLGWDISHIYQTTVDDALRFHRYHPQESVRVLSRGQREQLLLDKGYTQREILLASYQARKARTARQVNAQPHPLLYRLALAMMKTSSTTQSQTTTTSRRLSSHTVWPAPPSGGSGIKHHHHHHHHSKAAPQPCRYSLATAAAAAR